jgi:hypothetical protein
LLHGHARLWPVFGVFFIGGALFINIILAAFLYFSNALYSPSDVVKTVFFIAPKTILFLHALASSVVVWRCSRDSPVVHARIARFITIAYLAAVTAALFATGFLLIVMAASRTG